MHIICHTKGGILKTKNQKRAELLTEETSDQGLEELFTLRMIEFHAGGVILHCRAADTLTVDY